MTLEQKNRFFESAIKDLHWMARRYADGRNSYVTSMFNHIVFKLIDLGFEFETKDGTIWARDGGGEQYEGIRRDIREKRAR